MIFESREAAAYLLAARLSRYKGRKPLILGLPRGALPMARILAKELTGELGVVLTRKISIPNYEEFAIGAVSESGWVYRNPGAASLMIPEAVFQAAKIRQQALIAERSKEYRLDELHRSIKGRVAILVDDGIATGSTMFAAIQEVRAKEPAKLIVAAAVAPPRTARQIREEVDELVLLDEPENFYAVGQFFVDFRQVSDEEVKDILWGTSHKSSEAPRPSDSL